MVIRIYQYTIQLKYNYINTIVIKTRQPRCGNCTGCQAKECGNCTSCRDKPKYGGKGKKRHCCVNRRCHEIMSKSSKQTSISGIYVHA